MGAKVVGLDFSPAALTQARRLARETSLESRVSFIEGDVTEAGQVCGAPFDVVFTSIGAVVWIGNLEGWGATIAANLADHRFFCFLDAHPTAMIFDETSVTPVVACDCFHSETPLFESGGRPDYADGSCMIRADAHSFTWSVSDIFAALENHGLAIHEVREYPFSAWPQFPDMEKAGDGYWHHARDAGFPMLLGFKASRQASGAVS